MNPYRVRITTPADAEALREVGVAFKRNPPPPEVCWQYLKARQFEWEGMCNWAWANRN